jgi:hypothetical protein
LDGLGAKECAARCDDGKNETELENNNCKVCPKLDFTLDDLSEGFTSTKEEIENPCNFCALKNASAESTCSSLNRWDMIYPERNIRLFGNDGSQKIECWAIAEFYRSLNIEADNRYCESARQFNYVCGCSDSIGYVGANTELKMKALVWMPRIGAILSILVRNVVSPNNLCDHVFAVHRLVGVARVFLQHRSIYPLTNSIHFFFRNENRGRLA